MAGIGELVVKIKADKSNFKKGLMKAQQGTERFRKSVGANMAKVGKSIAAATLIVGAFGAAFTKAMFDSVDAMDDLIHKAIGLDIPTRKLQALAFAAELSGGNFEDLAKSIKVMQKNIGLASTGTGEAARFIELMNINIKELIQLSAEEQYLAIAKGVKGLKTQAEQAAAAMSLMGRGASLELLKSDLATATKQFEEFNLGLSDSQSKVITDLRDSRTRLETIWSGFKQQVTANVAPAFDLILTSVKNVADEYGGLKALSIDVAVVIVKSIKAINNVMMQAIGTVRTLKDGFSDLFKVGSRALQLLVDTPAETMAKAKKGKSITDVFTDRAKAIASNRSLDSDGLDEGLDKLIKDLQNSREQAVKQSRPPTLLPAGQIIDASVVGPGGDLPTSELRRQIERFNQGKNIQAEITIKADEGLKAEIASSPEVEAAVELKMSKTAQRLRRR